MRAVRAAALVPVGRRARTYIFRRTGCDSKRGCVEPDRGVRPIAADVLMKDAMVGYELDSRDSLLSPTPSF
jgi:hypothetical protein